jgi:tetratricopeptide (TPR) repeat protein
VSELIRLAEDKDLDGVLAGFRHRPPEEVLGVADRLREQGNYHVAIELYRWLLDQEKSAEVHFGLGQCYGKIYDFDAALAHLDQAFGSDPVRSDGASYYAYVLERLGRMAEADVWYRHALAGADADDLWARSHYAWFLEKWGRTGDACRAYDDVLDRNPLYTWAGKRYAMLLRRIGEGGQARALLRQTAERARGHGFAALNYLEYLLLDEDEEYPVFRASLDPTNGPAWYPVVLEMFDYYRDHLLPCRPDPVRLAAWEAATDALNDSVHRDFEDLTALLAERGGDVTAWRGQVRRLLK